MKKLTLFLVAIFAMVNVANAQRAWAYDLELTPSVDSYTFAFKAVTAGDATLVFYKEGEEAGTLNLGPVPAGAYTVTKTSEELLSAIGKAGDFTWGVKMSAGAIAEMKELTKDSETDFHFWMPTGVAVDNNPESPYFSQFYIASPRSGKMSEGGGNGIQHNAGVYVFDQTLKLLNETKQQGYLPSNVKSYVSGNNYMELHRIAVNPITHNVAFTHQSTSVAAAVWEMNPDNMKATATNLIDGTAITKSNSLCFDENGVLYVVNSTDKKVYTVKDGVAKTFGTSGEFGQERNAIATDGRGGVWVAQYRGQNITEDNTARLMHFNAEGTLDYKVDKDTPHGFTGTAQRGAVAYNTKEDVLAFGANRYGNLYKVTYNAETGVPSLESIGKTPSIAANIDGLAFDYAGDLYVTSASVERLFKYEVPTTNNTCTVPAKKSQVITLVSATPEYNVTINVNGNGTVTGANTGKYLEGTELTLTPKPNTGYEFTGWTFEDETTSTDNPLIITVDGDKNITANFAKKQYTLTVLANDAAKGDVTGNGTYEYGTEVEITATAKTGYEFTGWSNGSKENPLTITMEENTELTANFRAILPTSITLYAHPTKDYSTSIVGTMKRAIQNGENTIVLTHEDDGTPHIYNIAHTTKTVTEISQEGVVAAADGFLSISDIAVTEDSKLVACNYVHCTFTPSNTSYFYIWNDLAAAPSVWFTSQKSGNYNDAYMGYTMALKGTSQNAEVTISAFNKSNSNTRYSHLYVVDGTYSDASYKYSRDNAALHPTTLGKNTYELNASPLAAGKWIVDGELASPIEFVEKNAVAIDTYTALNTNVLGKKYNGASYLFHNDHHLMIAPYAGADGKLAGVKVLGISDGFGSAVEVTTSTNLASAINAEAAAATAYVDGDGDLTIYLIADGKVYPFSEKAYTAQTFTITAIAGEGGTVEGGGPYEENTTATLIATPAEHYDFVNWTEGEEVVSTTAEYSFTVTKDIELTANFQEHTKYTITAVANDENMGTVTGGDTYYVGESATLKATAKSGYVFAGWEDGEKNATRIVEVSADATYTANFQAIAPRAWAYDLKVVEDGDNYKFTFNTTAAGTATLLFADIDGNPVAPTSWDGGLVNAGDNTVLVEKAAFTETKDVYWSVKMDGEAIPAISEITDQSRGIYDFYNMMGVVVDNDPNSDYFGKIYIQQSYEYPGSGNTAERNKTQKAGIFIYDQGLNELNNPANTGIQPQLPYALGGDRQNFKRMTINPANGNIAFCNNKTENGGAYSVSRADLTSEAINLTKDIADIKNVNALCYDKDGNLYVVANVVTNYTNGDIYKIADDGTYTKLTPLRPDGKKIWVNEEIAVVSDGRGGIWVAQTRDNIDQYSALFHVNFDESKVDFVLEKGQGYSDWFETKNRRGAIAYDTQRNILAVHGPSAASLFSVEYDAEGVPSITKFLQTPNIGSSNIDGLAFDYAGDLYLVSSGTEKFYKYTIPTDENICTVPAPASQKLVLGTQCEVTVTVNDPAMGSVEGAGQYEKGATVELEATANEHYQFVNWTKGAEVLSTENPYSFTVQEDVTIIANFAELPTYTITVQANNNAMGSVEGGGTVHVGESVEIKAIPNSGHAFVKWDDGNTEATRTVEVVGDKTYTAIFQAMIPRAWAYDLRMVEDGDNYKFTFKATSAGTATLLFTNKAGTSVAPNSYAVGSVEAGEKSVTIAKSEFGGTEDIYWSVQMDGDAIENMIEITDASKGIYDIVAPQGIAVDNNTDSKHFGQVYVAAATDGTVSRGAQTRGIFVYDPILNELNSPNAGYLPTNATLTSNTRQAIHRVAVNPTNSQVAFAYNISGSTAVWSMNPENLAGDAVNLIDGAGITKANSICFDENGILYVMDNANTGTGGKIYKIQNGVGDVFADAQAGNLWAVEDNAMTSDGRGGLWIAQNRWSVDGYPVLSHVNSNGQVDFAVSQNSSAELQALFPYDDNNASYRGQCAYYVAEDILAFAGNKEAVLFKITYDANDVPTNLEKLMSTGKLGTNIDGLAFDYAGDLYVASENTKRFYKFVVPTNTNTFTVPAPESQVIQKETRYTVTVAVNDEAMGTATGGGTEFLAGDIATLSATANDGYQFVNWTKDGVEVSTEASFDYTVPAETVTLFANFEAKPLAIEGIVKRAVQIGESTVVLTHEADGTPHLYKVVDGTLEAELSQEGVVAAAAGYLSISDIAATEDGKLVACNYIECTFEPTNTSYFYIWNAIDEAPAVWFTSQKSTNYNNAYMGWTMAVKGTSTDAVVTISGFNKSNKKTRFSHLKVVGGSYDDATYEYSRDNAALHASVLGNAYELNASPLASANWIIDAELTSPIEFEGKNGVEIDTYTTMSEAFFGKKFNGATYFSIAGAHFMVAPYADAEGKVAGVKLMHITDGLAAAKELQVLDLATPEVASAAATAVLVEEVDNADGQIFNSVTITLVTDDKVHVLTTDLNIYVRDIAPSGNYGTICLPYNAIDYTGASLFEVAGKENGKLYFDEITTMEAGKPYLLLSEQSKLIVVYGTTYVVSPTNTGVMQGTFDKIVDDGTILEGNYMIYNNTLQLCGAGCWLNPYRAYFGKSELDALGKPMAPLPGRRRVEMGGASNNEATGLENITEGAGVITPIAEGTYDVLGRELSEPNATGFYIINGKKVVIVK